MKVNLSGLIKNFDGTEAKEVSGDKEKAVTYFDVITRALFTDNTGDDAKAKYKRYHLAMKLKESEDVDLSAEQITIIKEKVGEAFGALVVGQVWDFLDPKADEK